MRLSKLITVIIPTYNSEKYIRDCMNSLVLQSIKPRVLIADASSTDCTVDIIREYDNYLDITFASIQDNGQSEGINKALKFVETSHFFWLNSDDIIFNNYVELFEIEIKNAKNPLFLTANSVIILNGNIIKNSVGLKLTPRIIKNGVWFGVFPCVVWRVEDLRSLGGLNNLYHYAMDLEALLRISQSTSVSSNAYVHINQTLGAFRWHDGSKTGSGNNTLEYNGEMLRLYKEYDIWPFKSKIASLIIRLKSCRYIFNRFVNSNHKRINNNLKKIHNYKL